MSQFASALRSRRFARMAQVDDPQVATACDAAAAAADGISDAVDHLVLSEAMMADETCPLEPAEAPAASPRTSKSATVLALLARGEGASLDELVAATGWLPHTTRAALTGLGKKGHAIVREKREGVTRYVIRSKAAE